MVGIVLQMPSVDSGRDWTIGLVIVVLLLLLFSLKSSSLLTVSFPQQIFCISNIALAAISA